MLRGLAASACLLILFVGVSQAQTVRRSHNRHENSSPKTAGPEQPVRQAICVAVVRLCQATAFFKHLFGNSFAEQMLEKCVLPVQYCAHLPVQYYAHCV